MECADWRIVISALLDGEELPGEADAVQVHLSGCAACAAYLDRAARVTRLARMHAVTPVAEPAPIVLDVPAGHRSRLSAGSVRWALGAVGLGQCALAVAGILMPGSGHDGIELAGASAAHLSHESSAWNLALAIGFLWAATATSRPSGLVPLVGGFVAVLTVLSTVDVLRGGVDPARLLTHVLVVAGFALLVLLQRLPDRDGGGARAGTGRAAGTRPAGPDETGVDRPAAGPAGGMRPSARRPAA